MTVKVLVEQLIKGMYVCELDRPWTETPFLFQGFLIIAADEIDVIKSHCTYVYIDEDKGASLPDAIEYTSGQSAKKAIKLDSLPRKRIKKAEIPAPVVHYQDSATVQEEIKIAKGVHDNVASMVVKVMDDLRAGKVLDAPGLHTHVEDMTDSIIRNPDAFMLLTKLKEKDAYTYTHCVDACTLAIVFGRHLGMPKDELRNIAMGALLFDIGKTRIPKEILDKKSKLTTEEFDAIKKHVDYSVEILTQTLGISEVSIDVARHHHERHDGSGYPDGLTSDQLPVASRMAAIVDCYDAITSDRPYGSAMSPHEAIKRLYEWRDIDFQEELVEQFIQCLGVYPTGTTVELSTKEIGIILSQNRVRRLRPTILLVLDSKNQFYDTVDTIDLAVHSIDIEGHPLEIVRSVNPQDYGIDPREYYL